MGSKLAARSARSLAVRPAVDAGSIDAAVSHLKLIGFTSLEIRGILGVRTLPSRAGAGAMGGTTPNPRLAEIAAIISLARQIMGEKSLAWFLNPEPRLGNVLPATLLRDPQNGPNLVKQVLYNSLRGTIL